MGGANPAGAAGRGTAGQGGANAGRAGAGDTSVGGALSLATGGWGNVANGAGWGPTGELDPIPGEHDILEATCEGAPIGQEYVVQPNLICSHEYSLDGGTRIDPTYVVCGVADYCMHQSECDARPFGRCEGSPGVGCYYPREPCTTDADCTSAPDGKCPSYTETLRCESSDRCWVVQPACLYPNLGGGCATDADCTQRPGGECRRTITFARCIYDKCAADSDCAADEHCACSNDQRRCYPANCRSDADCAGGQSCQEFIGCRGLAGFYCTTPDDGCSSYDDCNGGPCNYDGSSFQCAEPCPPAR